jgi:hypothetical protein
MKPTSYDDQRCGFRECNGILSGCAVAVFFLVYAFAMACYAEEDFVSDAGDRSEYPKILMLEIAGAAKPDASLYEALLAQLSASPVTIDRTEVSKEVNFNADPIGHAARLATQYDARMVFWIDDAEICRLYFYIPDANGGKINSRRLDLSRNTSWSRTQIIAIAAASMVDGLLVRHRIRPVEEKMPVPPQDRSVVKVEEPREKTNRFEFSAGYAGDLFASEQFRHGVSAGLGGFVTEHVILSAAFIWYVPTSVRTDEFEMTIQSRTIDVSVAARWDLAPLEFRMGAAWQLDLRSVSVKSRAVDFFAAPDEFRAVSTGMPFIAAVWNLNRFVSVVGRIGAGFAVNDTVYKIQRSDGDSGELSPHHVRLTYLLGLIIRM